MYQIIVSQWGLSLGEIETINNLLKDYHVLENSINQNVGYASTLEIEFLKNKNTDFFDSITIEKWTDLVGVIKNIKKRRGKKGLKLKITIVDYFESEDTADINVNSKNDDEAGIEREVELLFFKRTIFLLAHKIDSEFIKGLERIEVAIENLTELLKKITRSSISEDQYESSKCEIGKAQMDHQSIRNNHYMPTSIEGSEVQMQIFLFDDKKRIWKSL
ncbi:MAG TPA: hypothetical protein VJP58_06510 [Candidatus Nitrosocosmicus sp.]|nr:hypothetical protein [Candidatus Nitrosocosmicus sp.]